MGMFNKQSWHNNRSPNPFNWEPILFFAGWLLIVLLLLPWALGGQ